MFRSIFRTLILVLFFAPFTAHAEPWIETPGQNNPTGESAPSVTPSPHAERLQRVLVHLMARSERRTREAAALGSHLPSQDQLVPAPQTPSEPFQPNEEVVAVGVPFRSSLSEQGFRLHSDHRPESVPPQTSPEKLSENALRQIQPDGNTEESSAEEAKVEVVDQMTEESRISPPPAPSPSETITHSDASPFSRALERMSINRAKRQKEAIRLKVKLPSQGGALPGSKAFPQLSETLEHLILKTPPSASPVTIHW